LTEAFRAGLAELLALADVTHRAIMCVEAVWWHCHWRIIADDLLARGNAVGPLHDCGPVDARNLRPWRARLHDDSVRRRDGDRRGGVRELKTTISRLSAFARRLL
jgi:hypothetical protein